MNHPPLSNPVAHELRALMPLAAAMLVFAPLFRGANRPLPLLALELGALLLLALVFVRPEAIRGLGRPMMFALGGLCLLPVLQLLPGLAGPGTGYYAEALAAATGAARAASAASLVPALTEASVLALLPPLAVFLATLSLGERSVARLLAVFLSVAVFQALLGLMQYGGGPESPLRFDYLPYGDSAIGTYANRSHLAGLLVMALPIALGWLASSVFRLDHSASRHRQHAGLLGRLKAMTGSAKHVNRTLLFSALCIALLLGVVFARSRTGIAVGMIGLLLTAVLLLRNFGGGLATRLVAGVSGLAVVLAVVVGLAPVFARFGLDATADARWPMLATTLSAGEDFLPLGSGIGTFAEVFRRFHPDEIGGTSFVNHAHNDFAEWWLEGGLPAMLLLVVFTALYLMRWRAVWRVRDWQPFHVAQVGAGVAVLSIALFGLTDYNLRIPANALFFAFMAAVFFHPGDPSRLGPRGATPARRPTPVKVVAVIGRDAKPVTGLAWDAPTAKPNGAGAAPATPSDGAAKNPFGD